LTGICIDLGNQRGRRLVGLARGCSQIPAVDEPVEHYEASECGSRHLTEGGLDRAIEGTGAVHSFGKLVQGRSEPGQYIGSVRLVGLDPLEGGGEGDGSADHVLKHPSDCELGARSRVIELVGADSADDDAEQWAEQVKLIQYIHLVASVLGSSIIDRVAMGNGEFGRLPVPTQPNEIGHTT
jgi:hypothetical protein